MNIVTLKQKKELIISIFGEGIPSSDGNDIAVYCPICKKSPKIKKKRKLSIAIETGMYHCWVCEAKGKSLTYFVKKNISNFQDIEKLKEYFGNEKEIEEEIEEKIKIELPADFKLVALSNTRESNNIKKYLYSRGMSENDLLKFKVGYSLSFEFRQKAIFPSLNEDLEINFYLTRIVNDEITKYSKYKNCDASKKDIIFNEYLIDWNKPVVIVEGIFDAVKAGDNAIPILGSWIDNSYELFKKIIKNNTPVILGLDPDAKNKEIKIAQYFYENGIDVKITDNHEKDLGDMTKEEVKIILNDAKSFDNIRRMRYLIQGIKSGSLY
jgi:DNA primase